MEDRTGSPSRGRASLMRGVSPNSDPFLASLPARNDVTSAHGEGPPWAAPARTDELHDRLLVAAERGAAAGQRPPAIPLASCKASSLRFPGPGVKNPAAHAEAEVVALRSVELPRRRLEVGLRLDEEGTAPASRSRAPRCLRDPATGRSSAKSSSVHGTRLRVKSVKILIFLELPFQSGSLIPKEHLL